MSNVYEVSDATFVEETKEGLVLVDFWAPWCGPCRMVAPVLDEISEELGDKVKIVKVNVDDNPDTSKEFGIMSIPTLLVKQNNEVKETIIGYRPKEELDEVIAKYL
ncbi:MULTISPECIES: thioredoxin [Brochothrix]|uniref:Thioredoxin n=1 Tax=Brochothrix thermosphacta TaxID=2756 RepID=A0A1D2K295_BROTH|nr:MULTISPECIES: thioredoxin [Brochothrix]SLM93252.1 Thioredoxin [Brachybacterium faecium]ANZ95740.1 thioredoxin [Brochothrix thermosphacta]ANZ98209.1 thioredoxin [Brochothrix thermosphacta]ATF25408.1 thioredoxin [Brochothrix thermosphacta]ATH84739.1 thioredoxin [Brochothrix thermosphacta]